MPDEAPAHAPKLSLPKGGGAIQGIGEKFAANPVTGTGSMSVPIVTSPGRSQVGPQLALSYDSGSGNGSFGFGWSLSLPTISRRTDRGLPEYRDAEESDVYLLSGAEDLVPVLRPDGTRFEDDATAAGYVIHRYRPRIEGLFARIERWTEVTTGEIHWRSITGDNVTTLYGKDGRSRIADPAAAAAPGRARVFSWLICASYDDKGNAIVYDYAAENDDNVDRGQPNERNRSRSANRYIKRIRYGNRAPNRDAATWRATDPTDLPDDTWMFEVAFDYGQGHYEDLALDPGQPEAEQHRLALASVSPSRPWAARPDPFSSHRAGFEVRAHRRCRRVLMFHHIPDLATGETGYDGLVRSTEFDYADLDYGQPVAIEDELAHQGSTRFASFIRAVTQSGYVRDDTRPVIARDGAEYATYLRASLPPLEFDYSRAAVQDEVLELDRDALENLPAGVDGSAYRWVDLDGEGLAGILTEQAAAWFYKPNLGDGRFGALRAVAAKPAMDGLGSGRVQLLDLAGDGQLDVVVLSGPTPGFFERTQENGWEPFRAFRRLPNIAWDDPNLRFVDLDGDGSADVLMAQQDALTWHPSLAEDGFGAARSVRQPAVEDRGPRIALADGTHSIYLADMCGDGLADLVRIRNGDVCYWPNLGYGRFGPKVAMDNPPRFDHGDQFDQRRVRVVDIDGSGTSDIIYLASDGVRLYFNQSGNRLSDARELANFPPIDDLCSVATTDLLGNGTACLVWSSPLTAGSGRQLRYVDLMGGSKPHLLVRTANNLGAETRVRYAPSTKFFLQDRRDGRPWITRLPVPVHVVERVESYDVISHSRFVTRFAYHHGHFDGEEREFRGFGMVEQWDTEAMAALTGSGDLPADNVDAASLVPPVLTKTWFHTGIYAGRDRVSDFFAGLGGPQDAGEYYREPGLSHDEVRALLLPDTILPDGLSAEEAREACRALRGVMLRQELYAVDGTPRAAHPYTVTEQNLHVRRVQERGDNRHAVFYTCANEAINFHYEREPADPRIQHVITLEVDDFGNVLREATIGYGRRHPDPDLPTPADRDAQTTTRVTTTVHAMTNALVDDADEYRNPLRCETRTYELTGHPATGPAGRYQPADFDGPDVEIAYEDAATAGPQRRLIDHERTLYRRNDLTGLLALGHLERGALPGEIYKLAFTPGLLAELYTRDGAGLLGADPAGILGSTGPDGGGYVRSQQLKAAGLFPGSDGDDHWWVPAGRVFLSAGAGDDAAQELAHARGHFFLPRRYRDPFAAETALIYDAYDLLVVDSRDAVGNRVTVGGRRADGSLDAAAPGNDYRVLQPALVTDANRNRTQIAFDALGMVVGSAVMGVDDNGPGDSLEGFVADLDESVVLAHVADPLADPGAILARATTRTVFDLFSYRRTKQLAAPEPAVAYTLSRETHDSDLGPGEQTRVQHEFSAVDGFGREIQKKVQAEPGAVVAGGPVVNPRWVGSGWTIFNNKNKPVRQYEPFFTATHRFEHGVEVGVSSVLFYDSVERVVAVLHPDHTFEKTVTGPWHTVNWDQNDTVLGDPRTDDDIGALTALYFAGLPTAWKTWHMERKDGDLGALEQLAAAKSAAHAGTPAAAHLDALGRPFLTVAHNKVAATGHPLDATEDRLHQRIELDIEGNQRAVHDASDQQGDASGRVVARYAYDMLGNRLRQHSMDGGRRWALPDIGGHMIRAWDDRGHALRIEYDALRRRLRSFARGGELGPDELLTERLVYGEQRADAEQHNLRARLCLHFDQAGVATTEELDFKGNLRRSSRRIATDYQSPIDWAAVDAVLPVAATDPLDPAALDAALAPLVEADAYAQEMAYDALGRPVTIRTPHTPPSVIRPTYNEANLLERVDANVRGATAGGALVWTPFVTAVEYDAKGRRQRIDYANGTSTSYAHDPNTLRLEHLVTRRGAAPDALQDLGYTYDAVGNVIHVKDDAQQTIFFRNRRVEPSADYTYDALYRLIVATGREHLGQVGGAPVPQSHDDAPRVGIDWSANDGNAMGAYLERYLYDAVGNLSQLQHRGSDPVHPGWSRTYEYAETSQIEDGTGGAPAKTSNRLTSTTVGNGAPVTEHYAHDVHGNMTRMPHLSGADPAPNMEWDFLDQLRKVDLGGRGTLYCVYDAGGKRVRKVWERAAGVVEERLYLGGFELFRRRRGADQLERETLHVMDGNQRIALVETRTVDTAADDPAPAQVFRFQLGNHLGSALLELDELARIVSYEEYYAYGGSSYQAVRSQTETPKRYRFAGKERDEETGLYYQGARFYAPWLARWVAADPAGLVDGLNRYAYVRANPIRLTDPSGTEGNDVGDFTVHGKKGYQRTATTMDIDEPRAVGEKGLSAADARARALDVNNRQFLDLMTNRRTKFLGVDMRPIQPPRPPVSVAENPSALLTRRFSEITEMQQVFDEAVRSVRNPNGMRPTALKNAINSKMWDIIKTGTSDAAVKVRGAFEKLGFENVPGKGYVLRTGPPPQAPAAPPAETPTAETPVEPIEEAPVRARGGFGTTKGVVNGAGIAAIAGQVLVDLHEGRPGGAVKTAALGVGGYQLMARVPALVPLAVMVSTINAYDDKVKEHAFGVGDWVERHTGSRGVGAFASAASATGESAFNGTFGVVGKSIGEGAAVLYIRATDDAYTVIPWKTQIASDIWSSIFD